VKEAHVAEQLETLRPFIMRPAGVFKLWEASTAY
jgi:hypothetical protein